MGQIFASLRHRDYRLLWIGSAFTSGGQWIQQVTLGWLLYDLTGSSVLLGALNGLRAAPFLITGPIAGVMADRMDRRLLLLWTQPALAVTTILMGLLVLSGYVQVWHLFAFTIITSLLFSYNRPVRQALVPMLVPRRDLMNAITLNSMANNGTKVIGPAIGGLLIVMFGGGGNFLVQGVAYTIVVWITYSMNVPRTNIPMKGQQKSAMADMMEGFKYVKSSPTVLALMAAALVPVVFSQPYQTLMPVFQKDVFQVGPEGLGLLMAAPGIGGLVTLLVLAAMAERLKRSGTLLLVGLMALGISLMLFSRTESLTIAILSLTVVGCSQMIFITTTNTMLQSVVPDELRGRVMSIYLLDRGLAPVGALLAGVSAHYLGAPTTVGWMGSVVLVLAFVLLWRVPHLRTIEAS
jgi:MFS family permease